MAPLAPRLPLLPLLLARPSPLLPLRAGSRALHSRKPVLSFPFSRVAPRASPLSMGITPARALAGRAAPSRERPKAKQSLGQNFLEDSSVAQRIVRALVAPVAGEGGGRVVEMGPGQGALTSHLLAAHPGMLAVEIDKRMVALLRAQLPALELRHMDFLALELDALAAERGGALALISNTPFYLTSQLLFKLVASAEVVEEAILTMQVEVAEKVLARPGSKQYGILSVMLQLFGRPARVFDIPPEAFSPAPKCHVAVVRFHPTAVPLGREHAFSRQQREKVLALLKLTFEHRRKMLRVTLKKLLPDAATAPPDDLLAKRPEQLEPQDFLVLADFIFGEDTATATQEDALARMSAAHASPSWQPHKAGWVKSSNKAAKRPLALGEYPRRGNDTE
ncbi:hypothetical protein AB1Y20_011613 [Prymnesium parvum]|uniref:rRNA adenine N(6)-methyltransferase n=1 Tax=Prymnesium parvum TaxID=97485 RepID=A0AB34IKH3_PRYPA